MTTNKDKVREEMLGYIRSASPNACSNCGADLTEEILAEQAIAYILAIKVNGKTIEELIEGNDTNTRYRDDNEGKGVNYDH